MSTIQHGVEGLMYLMTECAKLMVRHVLTIVYIPLGIGLGSNYIIAIFKCHKSRQSISKQIFQYRSITSTVLLL